MLGIDAFIRRAGNLFKAEALLMQHFAERRRVRFGWDRRYAEMEFGLRWDPVLHRHLQGRGAFPGAIR